MVRDSEANSESIVMRMSLQSNRARCRPGRKAHCGRPAKALKRRASALPVTLRLSCKIQVIFATTTRDVGHIMLMCLFSPAVRYGPSGSARAGPGLGSVNVAFA